MNRPLVFILAFTMILPCLLFGSDTTNEDMEFLNSAQLKSDLRELPSFTLKAKTRIEHQGKPLEGTYTLLWNGPNQWREEISFPGYSEIQIGGKGTIAIKRSLDFMPLRIHHLHLALGYGYSGWILHSDETVKRIRNEKIRGVEVRCAEIADKSNHREVCVDTSSGALVRDRPFEDAGWMVLGDKSFPKMVRYREDGAIVAQAEITELIDGVQAASSAFEIPNGAVTKAGCLSPSVGRAIKKVQPSYPEADRRNRVQGTVGMYAVIAEDGTLQGVRVVAGVSPGLDRASLDAVKQWRYEPSLCRDTVVPMETIIQVNYALSYGLP
jgi:TonB family protein